MGKNSNFLTSQNWKKKTPDFDWVFSFGAIFWVSFLLFEVWTIFQKVVAIDAKYFLRWCSLFFYLTKFCCFFQKKLGKVLEILSPSNLYIRLILLILEKIAKCLITKNKWKREKPWWCYIRKTDPKKPQLLMLNWGGKFGEEDLVKKTVVRKTLLQCFWTSRRRRRSSGPCEETGRTNLSSFFPRSSKSSWEFIPLLLNFAHWSSYRKICEDLGN